MIRKKVLRRKMCNLARIVALGAIADGLAALLMVVWTAVEDETSPEELEG